MSVITRSAVTQNVTERTRGLMTLLNFYYAGMAVLALVNLYLLVHIFFLWRAANRQDAQAVAQQTVAMKTAEIAAKPLQGLDEKLAQAKGDADKFYKQRLPIADSEVAAELGALAKKQGVKLTRVQYGHSVVPEDESLTEVRMDASLSGDYRPLVLFVNGLERDRMFFLINGVTLTGQQSGTVGLRLRLTSYLRAPMGEEKDKARAAGSADAGDKQRGGETP
jgi:type IV pilus assembly protein PilO